MSESEGENWRWGIGVGVLGYVASVFWRANTRLWSFLNSQGKREVMRGCGRGTAMAGLWRVGGRRWEVKNLLLLNDATFWGAYLLAPFLFICSIFSSSLYLYLFSA